MACSCVNSVLAIVLLLSTFKANAQITTPCTSSMIGSFTPCLNYVTGSSGTGSSPTKDCCNVFKSILLDSMDCACLIITGNVPVSVPFFNVNLAISLPKICKSSVPIQCKAPGDPLPAPGPVLFRPSAAPGSQSPKGPVLFPPSAAPGSQSPKASKAVAEAAPPIDDHTTNFSPATAPEFPLGPSANPGIRPVVNPNSASNPSAISFQSLVIMFMGIMIFN